MSSRIMRVRGGSNRVVLDRIAETGKIFWAERDRDWVLDGAAVHVSMVAFDNGSESHCVLDGTPVARINPDLTSSIDVTKAAILAENKNLAFIGTQKGGPFNLSAKSAQAMLAEPTNPNGRPNADVVQPWINASDVTKRNRAKWIIDFGTKMKETEAALYEAPFEYVVSKIKIKRLESSKRDSSNIKWWLHQRPRPKMRKALLGKSRFIVTPRHSKYRLFCWEQPEIVPDSALVVFAREDDYFFGILHSKIHEIWTRRKGTQVREAESGFRYTPTSTFETFPFPWPPGKEPMSDPLAQQVSAAASAIAQKRGSWLNPPGAPKRESKPKNAQSALL